MRFLRKVKIFLKNPKKICLVFMRFKKKVKIEKNFFYNFFSILCDFLFDVFQKFFLENVICYASEIKKFF